MSPVIVIGSLVEMLVLACWWITKMRANRRNSRNSIATRQEIAALRHALSEMAMERHQSHSGRSQRPR